MSHWGFDQTTFELSLEQQFELARIRATIVDIDAETLKQALIETHTLLMRKENVIKSLLKHK